MTKAELLARQLNVTVRHARRLLAEGDPRGTVVEVAELKDDEVAEQYAYDVIKDLFHARDRLEEAFGCWQPYYFGPLLKAKEWFNDKDLKRLQDLIVSYEKAGEHVCDLYDACNQFFRLFYNDVDAECKKTEREEKAAARKEKRSKSKPAPVAPAPTQEAAPI
jgi:hypothetical protein